MKKGYTVPQIILFKMSTADTLAANSFQVFRGSANEIESEEELLSRRHRSVWDDTEE